MSIVSLSLVIGAGTGWDRAGTGPGAGTGQEDSRASLQDLS